MDTYFSYAMTANDLLETDIIQEAIKLAQEEFVWRQKRAYGIDYVVEELEPDYGNIRENMNEWLENNHFVDVDTAAMQWLADDGKHIIQINI